MELFRSAAEIHTFVETYASPSLPLRNGFILHLHKVHNKQLNSLANYLISEFNYPIEQKVKLRVLLGLVTKTFAGKLKVLTSVDVKQKMINFFEEEFKMQPPLTGTSVIRAVSNNTPTTPSTPQPSKPQPSSTEPSKITTRNHCDRCAALQSDCIQKCKSLEKENKQKLLQIENVYQVKKVNQREKRLVKQIVNLKETQNTCIVSVKKQETTTKRKLAFVSKELCKNVSECKKLKKDISNLKRHISDLESDSESEEEEPVNRKTRTIDSKVRLCVYRNLELNVPVESIPESLRFTLSIFNIESIRLPSASTVSRCAWELGVLCDLQAAEFVVAADSLTSCWDATSTIGDHINHVYVSSPQSSMALSTDILPGGTADDYVEHLVRSLTHSAYINAAFYDADATQILSNMTQKIDCTLSDRAIVNSLVTTKLALALGVELIELHCNLHPLEVVAGGARSACLMNQKDVKLELWGKSAGVVNLPSSGN